MGPRMKRKLTIGIICCALLAFSGTWALAEVAAVQLGNADCVKCHQKEVQDVDGRGSLHKTAVGCLDCHVDHPLLGEEVIPACSMCHDPGEKAHYGIDNCISCHYPHYPMEMDFAKIESVKPICVTCHDNEGQQLDTYPSLHTELDCKACHLEHAQWQECLECHAGHTPEMAYQDCLRFHKPHMPKVVKYEDDIPNGFCSGCHETEVDVLAENTTKHHDLACVYCHKYQHKTVPKCSTCHGQPHGGDMHTKYPDCLSCHGDPHGLVK